MEITREYYNKLLTAYESKQPMTPLKEELGGGYYYRCPYLGCEKIIKQDYDYCPYCGVKLQWED